MLYKKQDKEVDMDRRSRKNCYIQLGRERFDFNKDEELLKYKYICGEKIDRKAWKKCLEKNMPYSYAQWERLIKEKYKEFNKEQLKEFEKYLEIGAFSKNIYKIKDNIILAGLMSAFFAAVFTIMIEFLTENAWAIWVVILICLLALIPMGHVSNIIDRHEFEQRMYRDYQKVIESLRK